MMMMMMMMMMIVITSSPTATRCCHMIHATREANCTLHARYKNIRISVYLFKCISICICMHTPFAMAELSTDVINIGTILRSITCCGVRGHICILV